MSLITKWAIEKIFHWFLRKLPQVSFHFHSKSDGTEIFLQILNNRFKSFKIIKLTHSCLYVPLTVVNCRIVRDHLGFPKWSLLFSLKWEQRLRKLSSSKKNSTNKKYIVCVRREFFGSISVFFLLILFWPLSKSELSTLKNLYCAYSIFILNLVKYI